MPGSPRGSPETSIRSKQAETASCFSCHGRQNNELRLYYNGVLLEPVLPRTEPAGCGRQRSFLHTLSQLSIRSSDRHLWSLSPHSPCWKSGPEYSGQSYHPHGIYRDHSGKLRCLPQRRRTGSIDVNTQCLVPHLRHLVPKPTVQLLLFGRAQQACQWGTYCLNQIAMTPQNWQPCTSMISTTTAMIQAAATLGNQIQS